jgi:hypothetical protein
MAMGKAEIYIMIRYETWIPGWRLAISTIAVPAVRVEAAWKIPFRTLYPGEILVTVGSLS